MEAREKRFEARLIAGLRNRGWYAIHLDANGADGWPDILAIKGRQFRLVEVKDGTERHKTQTAFARMIQEVYQSHIYLIEKNPTGFSLDKVLYSSLIEVLDEVIA